MSKPQAGWRAWFACVAIVLAGCTCSKRPGSEEGTGGAGGAGEPAPLGQDSARQGGEEIVLEVLSLSVGGEGAEASGTSFVTGESITARGRVRNAQELEGRIQWSLQPVGAQTGPAAPATKEGQEAVFSASSLVGTRGNREPNPPLEYELVASLPLEDGESLEVRLSPTTFLRQEEDDVLRQEYLDFGTRFKPARAHISIPGRPVLNTGNYSVIAETEAGGLSRLLNQLDERVNALLQNDVQVKQVGTRGLTPTTVVVSPGAPILTVLTDIQFAERLAGAGRVREAAQVFDAVWDATAREPRSERCQIFKSVDLDPYERIGARFAQRLREIRTACAGAPRLEGAVELERQGKDDAAIQELERQIQENPVPAEPYLALHRLHLKQGRVEEAAGVMARYF